LIQKTFANQGRKGIKSSPNAFTDRKADVDDSIAKSNFIKAPPRYIRESLKQ
jgi:hypothetical protein